MTDPDQIKADIDAARAELAETADALAARLDVKAQANGRLHAAAHKVGQRYRSIRNSAPPPVQQALDTAERAAQPALAAAAADKKRTALVGAGVLAAVLVAVRIGKKPPPKDA